MKTVCRRCGATLKIADEAVLSEAGKLARKRRRQPLTSEAARAMQALGAAAKRAKRDDIAKVKGEQT